MEMGGGWGVCRKIGGRSREKIPQREGGQGAGVSDPVELRKAVWVKIADDVLAALVRGENTARGLVSFGQGTE